MIKNVKHAGRHIVWLGVLLLFAINSNAQSAQDCNGAIPVCQSSYSQSTSYTGFGSTNELGPANQGCLTTGENNSVWYIVNISVAGTLTFDIVPNSATDDYDFAVYDLTDKSCTDIANGQPPIRCNYASLANSAAGGQTGLNTTSTAPSLGAGGPSYSSAINATVGQTFLILINNASASANGYNLNFGGTASVVDNLPPAIKADTLEAGCSNPSFIMLQLAENIQCNSLAANGSDFSLSPASATIASAFSQSCSNGSNFTNLIRVNFSNPLPPGNYTLSVVNGSDANTLIDNCNNAMPQNTTRSFVVQPPVQVNVTTQPGCANTANGVITANGQFGTSPYQYRINNGTFGNSNVFSGLAVGTYTVQIRDFNGCLHDTTVTLSNANAISINGLQITNPTCFGQNNGSVVITASGGNPPLEYTVNTQPYQSSNTISGLGPGNYVVRVRDASGCIEDSVIFISAPGQLSFNNLTVTPATCGQNNGAISATGFGGTAPLTYSLNSGPSQNNANFTGLASGSYTLRLTDGNGCFFDTVLQIIQITPVSITSVNITQPTCTANSGSITVNSSGGTTPIQYSLNGGSPQTSNSFPNLSSGTYTITATDANGCTSTSIANLVSPGNMYYTSATIVQPTCTTLGSISVQGTGGTPPLTYAINTGPYSANSTFTNLAPGTYTIHLQDANNCIHDTIITLAATQVPSFSSVPTTQPSCSFPNSGSITANVTGGTPAYSYSLNGGPNSANNNFTNLSGGSYTITVTDANGCTITTLINLQQSNYLSFSQFNAVDVGCQGSPLGSITSAITGGNPAYQYSLNSGPQQGSGNFTGLTAGTYTVVATDASGCTISSSVTINTSGTVLINSLSSTNSPCASPATGTVTVSGTVSNPPIQYTLTPGGSNTTGNFTGLGAGTYTVQVSDAAGCTVTSTVVITAPPPMSFTNVQIVFPPCYGGIGSISLMGQGGQPPYQYRINNGPFGPVSNWNNLPAGTYTIRLQDANGCYRDTTINLMEPPDLIITNTLIVNAACNNAPTGSVTVSATGGVPPYQYQLGTGPFGTNNTFGNLGAGTYTITVRDANNCLESTSVTILPNGNFVINSINFTQPSCNGASDGAISFTVTGGISPYQYSLNLGAYQAANNFTGLAAGSYNLRSIDNSGCFDDTTVNLSQPTPVSFASVVPNNPSCNGTSDGTITVTGTGGTPGYTYAVNAGPFGTSNILGGLPAGTHTIRVRDANNCQFNSTVTLSNPTSIFITNLTVINPGCLGGGGTISYAGGGGTSPYSYSIDGINYVNTGLFSNLPNGTHTVYVRDANGCTEDTTLTLSGSAAVTITSLSFSPYVCPGQTNGTITITATSANPPIQYNIIGNPQQPTGNFTGLGPGVYTVRSEDLQGCYADTTLTILQAPVTMIDSVSITPATCANSTDGALTIYATGGVQPLSYQLGGSGYTSNNTYSNLGPGNNIAWVRDSAGCIVNSPVVIPSPPAILVNSLTIQQPFCSNATDGQIAISVSGGVPPYLYAINTSLYTTSSTFSNLIQGVYVIHIRDANNCQLDTTINLVANNIMQFTNIAIQNVSCAGGNDGSISLNTTGGTAPYSYSINTIPNGNSGSFANLGPGQYQIQVTDNLGCQYDSTFIITQPANGLTITQTFMSPNRCKGDSSGIIGVTASGGTPPYQYSLGGTIYQAQSSFNSLLAGFYQIFAQDANGCITDSIFEVTEPDTSVQISLVGVTPQSCVGVDDGTVEVLVQYGAEPYTLYLNGTTVGTDTFYSNLAPGDYVVEVIDSIGCRSTGKYNVPASTIDPIIIIDSLVTPLCRGDRDGYVRWTTTSPYPAFTYSFNGTSTGSSNEALNLGIGTYTIELTDDRGCTADTTFDLTEQNPMDLEVFTTPARCEGTGDDGGARAVVTGGQSPYTYLWSSTVGNTGDSVAPLRYGDYFVIVFDDLNCSDTARFTVEYEPCCNVVLPNAFTPNGDGLNDVFRIIGFGQLELERFEIFNRWGNRVFSTSIITDAWDGTYRGEYSELGTYYYYVKYRCHITGGIQQKQGDVTLIR